MPRSPAPYVTEQDLTDAIEEAIRLGDTRHAETLTRQLQTRLAQQALRIATARSIQDNGMTERSRDLLRDMGWTVRSIT